MSDPFRRQAEEDERDQANASLDVGQQQVEQQQDPEVDTSLDTRTKQWNLNEDKRLEYEAKVRDAEAKRARQPSAEAWQRVADAGGGRHASQQAQDARQNDALIEQSKTAIPQNNLNRIKEDDQARAAVQRQEEQDKKKQLRIFEANGGETTLDPTTGEKTIARHPDGSPKSKPGAIEGEKPFLTEYRTPADAAASILGGGTDTGVLGATGGEQAEGKLVQPTRNDRFETANVPIEKKTDPKTGEIYSETKDEFGNPTRVTFGQDQKIPRLNQIGQEIDTREMELQALDVQRMQIEPGFKATETAYNELKKKREAKQPFIQVDGKWIETPSEEIPKDPKDRAAWLKTQDKAQPEKLAVYQRSRAMDEPAWNKASKEYEAARPQWENLQSTTDALKLKKEQAILTKKRVELDLPEEDGGIAATLTAADAGLPEGGFKPVLDAIREHGTTYQMATGLTESGQGIEMGTINSAESPQPGEGIPTDAEIEGTVTASSNAGEAPPQIAPSVPLIPQDDPAKLKAFTSSFKGLANPEQFTLGAKGANYQYIQKDGLNIASLDTNRKNGHAFLLLNEADRSRFDLKGLINTDAKDGLPVYLAEREQQPDPITEARWASDVFVTIADIVNGTFAEGPGSKEAQHAKLKEMGADLPSLQKKVNSGEISVQTGGALMKELYGVSLTPAEYDSPQAFQKYIEETTKKELAEGVKPELTTAAKWKEANTADNFSLSGKEQVKNDYAADYILQNRHSPLLTRADQKALYAKNADTADVSFVDQLNSKLTATKKFAANSLIAPVVGIGIGIGRDAAQAVFSGSETALFGDSKGYKDLEASLALRYGGAAANVQGMERNREKWFTKEGIQLVGNLDTALNAYRDIVDANEDTATPNKAAEDAARKQVIELGLAMHNLARNDDDPISEKDIDPHQDKALAMALVRYKGTADPRAWELLKDRLLMSNDRRRVSAEMEAKTKGMGEFMAALTMGSYADPIEIGSEALSVFTMGGYGALAKGGKAVNVALKGNSLYKASRVGKIATTLTNGLRKEALAFKALGTAKGTLEKPLTMGQKVGNAALTGGKGMALGGGSEAIEEVVVELGADSPDLAKAAAGGFFGGMLMLPVGLAQQKTGEAIATYQQQAQLKEGYHKYSRDYNTLNADVPGFEPIDAATAELASLIINPQDRAVGTQAIAAEVSALQENIALQESAAAAGQPIDAALPAMRERLQTLETTSVMLAEMDIAAIDSVQRYATLPAEQKQTALAYAKVNAGRADLLTPQERKSIQGQTPNGVPMFAGDTFTPEGAAYLAEQFPEIARAAAIDAPQPTPPDGPTNTDPTIPPTDSPQRPNIQRVEIDEPTQARANTISQQVLDRVRATSPAIAAKISLVEQHPTYTSGGVQMNFDPEAPINIVPGDVAQLIAASPNATDAEIVQSLTEIIETHEVTHLAQFEQSKAEAKARGLTGTDSENFFTIYNERATQYQAESPEAWNVAAELYGRNSENKSDEFTGWTSLKPAAQAAEVERMFVESLISKNGTPTDANRLLGSAQGTLKTRLLELAQWIGDLITGNLRDAQGNVVPVPESIKARAQEIAATVEVIRTGTPLNVTPSTTNTSSPNTANSQQQSTPSQTGNGTGTPPQGNGNSQPANNGGTQPPPGNNAGASPPAEEVADRRVATARTVNTELKNTLTAQPRLKKSEFQEGIRLAAFEASEAAFQANASPEETARLAQEAMHNYRTSPEVQSRIADLKGEESSKAKQVRQAKQQIVDQAADEVIKGTSLLKAMDDNGLRFEGPPKGYGLIFKKAALAKKNPDIKLTPQEQTIYDRFSSAGYNGMPKISDYPGGGKNAVMRSLIRRFFVEGGGYAPDQIAEYEELTPHTPTNHSPMEAFSKALQDYAWGRSTLSTIEDPDAELTDDQIDQAIEKSNKAAIVEKWRGPDNKPILPATAQAYEDEFTKLAARNDFEMNEEGMLVDPFNDPISPEDRSAIESEARRTVDARLEVEAEARRPKTPAQTATLNSRVEELSKPMEGGLLATEAVLDTAPLKAIQNHLPSITKVTDTPLVKRALSIAERIIPYFQGNKLKMTGPVVSAQEKISTPEQRAKVSVLHDLFGGGGAWGMVLSELYPNLKKIHINEFDPTRAIKIKAQIEYGDQFAEIVNTPAVRNALASMIAAHAQRPAVQRKIAAQNAKNAQGDFIGQENYTPEQVAEMNEAWSWGVINKTAAQYAKSQHPKQQEQIIAILKTMADDPERSGPWYKADPDAAPTVDELVQWFQSRHAPKAAAIKAHAKMLGDRGVKFEFTTGDAYALDIERGDHVAVVADPPYFATTGYDEVNQKTVVGTDYYQRSANLMESLVGNENHVIYTDEAWWLRKDIDNAIRPADLVTGQKLAEQISNTLDFTVVADQIDSRYETLGLHNPAGSPMAASRSSSSRRDLRSNDQGNRDGGGNQRSGGTPSGEVSTGTDGQAGIQPAADARLGSAPAQADRSQGESGKDYYQRITKAPVVRFEQSRIVHHTTGQKSADAITAGGFKSGKEVGLAEKRGGVYFADEDVNPGIYARTGEDEAHQGQEARTLPIDIRGLTLLNNEYAPDQGYPNHKQYGNKRIRGEFDTLPEGVDGYISFLNDGRIYEVAIPAETANRAREDNRLFSPAAQAKEWTPKEIAALEEKVAHLKITGRPITPKNAFGDWAASPEDAGIIYGYRGESAPGAFTYPPTDNNNGSSEGVGLYIAKDSRDSEIFGKPRRVPFPEPKRPLIVDNDNGDPLPLLQEDEAAWERILSHKTEKGDSDWIKAHTLAAKQIGLTDETWQEKIDQFPRALTDVMLNMGYDAVYTRSAGMEWVTILAKPNQRFNRGTRSAGGTALYSAPPQNPGFYSPLERAIETKLPANAPLEQIVGIVRNNARPEEIKWSGILPATDRIARENNGKVPKAALLEYLRNEGALKLEEVVIQDDRGEGFTVEESNGVWVVKNRDGQAVNFGKTREESEKWQAQHEGSGIGRATKWASHTVPGGENYRETVLSMGEDGHLSARLGAINNRIAEIEAMDPEDAESAIYADEYQRLSKEKDGIKVEPSDGYRSPHFPGISGYIAHMRVNERADASGKRGLFMETLQSDRHQSGKDLGYLEENQPAEKLLESVGLRHVSDGPNEGALDSEGFEVVPADAANRPSRFTDKGRRVATPEELAVFKKIQTPPGVIADAPFRKDWHVQLFKRALRDAVSKNLEWVGWTDGNTQVDRWHRTGKEADAMRTFYDKVIPQDVNRYVKQWEAKVKADQLGTTETDIAKFRSQYREQNPNASNEQVLVAFTKNKKTAPIWRVDITPEMRKGVEQGQALFSAPVQNPAAQYRYLKDKEAKAGLTPAEQQALLQSEKAMGQSFAIDMDDPALKSRSKGSVSPSFQPQLKLETQHPVTGRQLALFSPATQPIDDTPALDAALKGMDPIYRKVFQASQRATTPTPQELAAEFSLPERAIVNIIGTARTRIQAHGRTIRPGGLQPAKTADGKLKGGMPSRANSTTPALAAVDQIQQQEGLPLGTPDHEIIAAATKISSRPDAEQVIAASFSAGERSPAMVAATHQFLLEAGIKGLQSPTITEIALQYRAEGTAWADAGRARKDPHLTPAERNALIFQELFTSPNKGVQKAWREAKTPEQKQAILQEWNARVKGIKEALKARGLDLQEAMDRLAAQRNDAQAAEQEASQAHQKLVDRLQNDVTRLQAELAAAQDQAAKDVAQAKLDKATEQAAEAKALDPSNTIRLELEKLNKLERAAIEELRDGGTWQTAASVSFLSVADVKRVFDKFADALDDAGMRAILLAEDILLDQQARLGAPAANAMSREERAKQAAAGIRKALGYDSALIDRRSKGITPKQKKGKAQKQPAAAKPEPADMTDEQFQAYLDNPQTWRPAWQGEMAITGENTSFDQWINKPETRARKTRLTRMSKQPVSTTTGELDMHDPLSVKRAFDEFNIHNASLFDKAVSIWRMGILSGLHTGIINFTGNVAHSQYNLWPRRLMEAGVNNALSMLGLGSKEAATFGELKYMAQAQHKAMSRAGTAMITAWNMDSRIVESEVLALGAQLEFSGIGADYIPKSVGGPLGKLLHAISFRHMTAADEMIKAYHSQTEVMAQAYRIAKNEKLTGEAFDKRMDELLEYGSPAWKKAMDSATWVTFQNEVDPKNQRSLAIFDRAAYGLRRLSQTDTGRTKEITNAKGKKVTVPITKPNAFAFFFPFINTPLNIMKIGIEMSPIGAFFSIVDAARALKIRVEGKSISPELANQEASELYDRLRLVQDLTNQIIGMGMFYALGSLVKPGDEDDLPWITGSTDWKSTSKGDRDLRARVMPAYTVRIPFTDAMLNYQRLEPFGTAMGFIVDMRIAVNKKGFSDEALGEFMASAINQFNDKTYMKGLSDLMSLWNDPERIGTRLTSSIVTGFIPNLIRQPIREADPYLRDTKPGADIGFVEGVWHNIKYSLAPGYAPIAQDVWGNPLKRHPGMQVGNVHTDVLLRVFDPTNLTVRDQIDPLDLYLFNWNNTASTPKERFNIEPIQKNLQIDRHGKTHTVTLTPEEHAQANRNAGKAAREMLGNDWDASNPQAQEVERVKEVLQKYQKRERDQLRDKYRSTLPQD